VNYHFRCFLTPSRSRRENNIAVLSEFHLGIISAEQDPVAVIFASNLSVVGKHDLTSRTNTQTAAYVRVPIDIQLASRCRGANPHIAGWHQGNMIVYIIRNAYF